MRKNTWMNRLKSLFTPGDGPDPFEEFLEESVQVPDESAPLKAKESFFSGRNQTHH